LRSTREYSEGSAGRVRLEAQFLNPKPQGEITMIKPQVKPIPDGMHSVTPHLICAGAADAIEFYKRAFNAVETGRMPGPQGKLIHAAIRIGDSVVMLVDEFPD